MEKVKLSEKFMLTIKEANIYFGIGEKKLRRLAEDNEGSFALFTGNRYLIIRPLMEQYFSTGSGSSSTVRRLQNT